MKIQNLFFEPLALKHTWENKVFFWSDLHLRHNRDFIYAPRNFRDVREAEHTILQRWREKITANDIVFLLGDTVFGMNGEEYLNDLFYKLPFKELFIMPGNHYAGYKQVFNEMAQNQHETTINLDTTGKLIHFIPNYLEIFVNGQPIVLSHYPILSWNGHSKGAWHLYGHVHNNLKHDLGKAIDVGVENCPYPIDFNDIAKIMKDKEIQKVDHHGAKDLNPF